MEPDTEAIRQSLLRLLIRASRDGNTATLIMIGAWFVLNAPSGMIEAFEGDIREFNKENANEIP